MQESGVAEWQRWKSQEVFLIGGRSFVPVLDATRREFARSKIEKLQSIQLARKLNRWGIP
jgi:hypothetical protein